MTFSFKAKEIQKYIKNLGCLGLKALRPNDFFSLEFTKALTHVSDFVGNKVTPCLLGGRVTLQKRVTLLRGSEDNPLYLWSVFPSASSSNEHNLA